MNEKLETKRTSLRTQVDLLEMLRGRHHLWLNEKLEAPIKAKHLEIIDLFSALIRKYYDLIELYQ